MNAKKRRADARREIATKAWAEHQAAAFALEHAEKELRYVVLHHAHDPVDPVRSPKTAAMRAETRAKAEAAVVAAKERMAVADRIYRAALRLNPPRRRRRGRPAGTSKSHGVETDAPGREGRRASPGERTYTLLRVARLHVRGKASRAELEDAMWHLKGSRQHDPADNRMRGRASPVASRKKVLVRWELEVVRYLNGKRTRAELRRALPKGRLAKVELRVPTRRLHPATLRRLDWEI